MSMNYRLAANAAHTSHRSGGAERVGGGQRGSVAPKQIDNDDPSSGNNGTTSDFLQAVIFPP